MSESASELGSANYVRGAVTRKKDDLSLDTIAES